MAKILFLTDSAADIPKSLREELGIRVMPFPIAMGERELRDGEDFTPQEFYQALAEEPKIPTHAQLTAYQFQQCYEETWKAGYTDLIYTSINSEGSATYQNAVQARGEFFEDHPEARDAFSIRVIDSPTYTMCYGYPVAEGARMAAAGASVEEIAAYIATGEPMDKAGSYGIQGYGAMFVSHLEGDYFSVMGLPLCPLCRMLRAFGVSILTEKEAQEA